MVAVVRDVSVETHLHHGILIGSFPRVAPNVGYRVNVNVQLGFAPFRKHEEVGCYLSPQYPVRAESVEALAFQPVSVRCILECFGNRNLKSWMIGRTVEVELCLASFFLLVCVSQ
jgi:hypothetical protein